MVILPLILVIYATKTYLLCIEVILVIKDETQVELAPEQEEPTVKEQENLPQEIIVDKGKF